MIWTGMKGGLISSHNGEVQGAESYIVGPQDLSGIIRTQSFFLHLSSLLSLVSGTFRFIFLQHQIKHSLQKVKAQL